MKTSPDNSAALQSISENDVLEGMKALEGYFDLTPHDFRILYDQVRIFAQKRLLRERLASDIMTSPAVCVHTTDSVATLVSILAENRISGVPVLDATKKVAGVVSEKDVLALLGKKPASHVMQLVRDSVVTPLYASKTAMSKRVEEIMSAPAITVSPSATLADVVEAFTARAVNRMPVTDEDNRLLGLITRSDMIFAMQRLAC